MERHAEWRMKDRNWRVESMETLWVVWEGVGSQERMALNITSWGSGRSGMPYVMG
jgi:hypothetical protein